MLFSDIGNTMKHAEENSEAGIPCFSIHGKPFIGFYQNCMVFKLDGDAHSSALELDGARLFDEALAGNWVQVPFNHKDAWTTLARSAYNFVNGSN